MGKIKIVKTGWIGENMQGELTVKMQNEMRLLAADYLVKNREAIRNSWEKRINEEVHLPKLKKLPVIDGLLGGFFEDLSMMLKQATPQPERLYKNSIAKVYQAKEVLAEEYSLSDILRVFSLLREAITQELENCHMLTYEVRSIIDQAIDPAIALAVKDFENAQIASLETALAKAELSNKDLEQFAMIAAHDLSSPLATVTSLLSLLKESISTPDAKEYAGLMEETLERMRSLVRSVLEYARLAKTDTQFRNVNLQEVFNACIQNLNTLINNEGARVHSDPLPEVFGDFNLLTQVFQNLIANSIKFRSKSAPEIHISVTEKDSKFWLFTVTDNGIGFEIKNNEEIFSLYKRLGNKADVPGSGIGLATCRRVIELHRGKIWAESRPGEGSKFHFTLPKLLFNA